GLIGEARRHAEAAYAVGINQRRLWLVIADIEEAEGGDSGQGRCAPGGGVRRGLPSRADWPRATRCAMPRPPTPTLNGAAARATPHTRRGIRRAPTASRSPASIGAQDL